MRNVLLWLCLALPLLGISQTSQADVIFRLDLNDVAIQDSIPEPIQAVHLIADTYATALGDSEGTDAYGSIELQDDDGNGIWRRTVYINVNEGENTSFNYIFKLIGASGNIYFEQNIENCSIDGSNFDFESGKVRNLLVPLDVPEDKKVSTCWDKCAWGCPPPPCETGLTATDAYQICNPGGQAVAIFTWETECPIQSVIYSNAEGAGPFEYEVAEDAKNFGVFAGNGQMPPNWNVEHYLQVKFAAGDLSKTIVYTPNPCIEGCTDPTQESYNPWATVDDGSCAGTTCDTTITDQITMEITFDNWPSETSWSMTSGVYGIIGEELAGAYDYNDIGQTYTYNFCVDKNAGFELILNDTFGDGLAGSTSGGTLDGSVRIFDCNGALIWELENPDFGEVAYSGQLFGAECEVVEEILGCTDPNYQEYNPEANVDDGSCSTPHILGCTDSNSINFNPDATKQELIDVCDYNLIIKDAAGDGWGNSFIGVSQGGVSLGTYTMGPGNYEQVFPLKLSSAEPVKVYYFQVGGPQSTPQEVQFQTWHNSFLIEGLDGEILLSEGENPFENNGQGALQNFESPFYITYTALPFCGTTCIPIVEGCTTEGSLNYNPDANVDDGSCVPYIEGCTNSLAFNYNPDATVDDGSCVEVVVGCMDPTSFNYNPEANTAGDCIPVIKGCMDPESFNYNENANTDDGSCIPVVKGCMDENSINYNDKANVDDGSCIPIVYGCTDPDSFNFNVNANVDDGSCIPVVYGCTDPDAFNYNPDANTDNGTCEAIVFGCTDKEAFNFNPDANTDNGTCIPVVLGCTDNTSLNYDPQANTDDGSCIPIIEGCTDPESFNYKTLAKTDDGSCNPVVYGCTDNTSLNYNPEANTDDGSCIPILYGCMDPESFNYNPLATVDDGSCTPIITGCTDPNALNYNPNANTEDYSCIEKVFGCMDPTSINYNPEANVDNGTCITAVVGCTDPNSYNYNPEANVSDPDSCLYDAGCVGGPGNPYWLNDQCYAWVIDVDNYCCDNEFDSICQEMYNYCAAGWPEGFDIDSVQAQFSRINNIIVHPNPTTGVIYVSSNIEGVTFKVRDLLGKEIIPETSGEMIDLSNSPSGLYILTIKNGIQTYNKRIIKQ